MAALCNSSWNINLLYCLHNSHKVSIVAAAVRSRALLTAHTAAISKISIQDSHTIFQLQDQLPAEFTITLDVMEAAHSKVGWTNKPTLSYLILSKVKVNKATGPDDIPPWLLKDFSALLATPLTAGGLPTTSLEDCWCHPSPQEISPIGGPEWYKTHPTHTYCSLWRSRVTQYLSYSHLL